MRKLNLAAAAALTVLLAPAAVHAHGAMSREHEVCVLKVGPDFMYFSGYQLAAPQEKFCEDVPQTGETTFVFDYAQDEMRQMKADFRIIRRPKDEEETPFSPSQTGSAVYSPP